MTCPQCKTKQPKSRLLLMSSTSEWRCNTCNLIIGPKNVSNTSNILGFLTSFIPAYISLFLFEINLIKSLFIGLVFGVCGYILCLIYYAIKTELEIK